MAKRPWRLDPESILDGLLAMAANRRRPGDPITLQHRAAMTAGMRRRRDRLQREARRGAYVRQAARRAARNNQRRYGDRISDRMLAGMEPGGWYGRGDLIRFAGAGRDARGKVQQALLARGLVERQRNPAWAGTLSPWVLMSGAVEQEPQWLYRLTARGELERAALLLLA